MSESYRPVPRCARAALVGAAAACALAALGALPPIAAAQLAADVEDAFGRAIVGVAGTEATGTHEFDYLGVHVRIDILGVVFCSPADPWAPPNPNPVPPQTAYGCVNTYQVAAEVSPAEDAVRVTLTLPVIFVDAATQRTESVLCGEIGSGTVSGDAYLLTSGVVAVDFTLTGGTCVQAALVPGSVTLQLGSVTAEFQDDCLANFWSVLSADLLPDLEAALRGGMEDLIAARLTAFNQELCTLTPADESTWGRVKGLYGEPGR